MVRTPQVECAPRTAIQQQQLQRLQATVERVFTNVPFFAEKMKDAGVKPADIRTLADLKNLPFTTKQDLRDTYPFGLFACPKDDVVRLHATSGTTGKPAVVGVTRNDIAFWSELVARALSAAGVTTGDTLHVAYGYGLFTGGLGLHYGGEALGCRVVPISSGNTQKQVMLMHDFGATALACTPSYALHLAEVINDMGYAGKMQLKCGIFGAEPWTEAMRETIEKSLNIKAFDIYGTAELIGPGVAFECPHGGGLHINEDHFLPEIIDPDTLEAVPDGEEGELVFTCITKEALPLIRYRTRDISALYTEACPCGRTIARMRRVRDRSDDMLIIRGVNVYPSQIESALLGVGQTAPHFQIIVDRKNNTDTLEILVEMPENTVLDTVGQIENLRARIDGALETTLGLSCVVKLVGPRSIQRSEGKAVRVVDKRK
ncbi:MAG: phenylacetate--CoA ligase [Clostridia bacterium]|nr:phenylacetate--CoA ligase [Clostridia bacterium]